MQIQTALTLLFAALTVANPVNPGAQSKPGSPNTASLPEYCHRHQTPGKAAAGALHKRGMTTCVAGCLSTGEVCRHHFSVVNLAICTYWCEFYGQDL